MKRKPKFVLPTKYILLILSGVCIVAILLSFTLGISGGPLNTVAGYVFIPMQRGINSVGSWIGEKADNLKKLNDVMAENEDLKRQVDDLTTELNTIKLEQYELDNLRELLKLDQKYPDKSRRIQKFLSELSEMEKSGEKDIDKMAGCFGKIMEEIFAWKQDVWEDTLRRMGFFLGKFIYLLDAYDDVEEDIKNKNYNPFSEQYIIEGFDEQVRRILIMMMAQTCREFEKLPIIKYTDILRNILYSGVWCRFEVIHKKRKEAGEKDND